MTDQGSQISQGLFSLNGKTAVVTGGGSGIGEAISRVFAAQGANLALLDRDIDAAGEVAKSIAASGSQAFAIDCDVSDAESVAAAIEQVSDRHGQIEILVNNAGVAHVGNVLKTTTEDFERLFRVNVLGVHNCTKTVLPLMIRNGGGVILNMASIASLIAVEDRWAYTMTKGAVLAMTRSIALDFIAEGVRCNCICPARVHTKFVDQFVAENYPGREQQMLEELAQYQPIGRMGTPTEVAHLALYLCSDESSFVTGQAYPLDGGVLVK